MKSTADIYSSGFIKNLFDEMSQTYGLVNYVSSFGFAERWRRQCVQQLSLVPGLAVYDLMTGMGECWSLILDRIQKSGRLFALDLSPLMLEKAQEKLQKWGGFAIDIIQEDVLNNRIPAASADCIVSAFGIKTFSEQQQELFVKSGVYSNQVESSRWWKSQCRLILSFACPICFISNRLSL